MTCLQIPYFFQCREEEEERAVLSLRAWHAVVFHSKEVGRFRKQQGICLAASGQSGTLGNFPRWGGSSYGRGLCPLAWLPGDGLLWGECPTLPRERPRFSPCNLD